MELLLTDKDLALSRDPCLGASNYVDYRNVVCVKPWGHEFLAFESDRLGIWCLTVRKGHSTSLHCHFRKDTVMIVLSGCAKLTTLDKTIDLPVMSRIRIPKRKFHAISSFSDETTILEIEVFDTNVNFSDKNDLLRITDNYDRQQTGYTGSVTLSYDLPKYGHFWLGEDCDVNILGNTIKVKTHKVPTRVSGMILKGTNYSNGVYMKPGSFCDTECVDVTTLSVTRRYHHEDAKLIYSLEHLKAVRERLGATPIVLTSGCFDIIHVGHLHNLKMAKTYGDVLMVCLSSDAQIKGLKGSSRPVNNIDDRVNLFKTISYVDYIILYDEANLETETTLDTIIKCVDPEYWTKGSDYSSESILAKHPTLRNIAIIPNIPEKSTTHIVQRIFSTQ